MTIYNNNPNELEKAKLSAFADVKNLMVDMLKKQRRERIAELKNNPSTSTKDITKIYRIYNVEGIFSFNCTTKKEAKMRYNKCIDIENAINPNNKQKPKIVERYVKDLPTYFKDNNNRCFFLGRNDFKGSVNFLSAGKSKINRRCARIAVEYVLHKNDSSAIIRRESWMSSLLSNAYRFLYKEDDQ